MNTKPPAEVLKRPVCTWLSEADHARFEAIAKSHGVSVSRYLRSIVVDVLAEEEAVRPVVSSVGSVELAGV